MLTLTNALIDSALARLGLHRRQNGETALLGIRGSIPLDGHTIKNGQDAQNTYNDSVVVYGPTLRVFQASVDPGATYTEHPDNPQGCAHLLDGSYMYQWGDHKGHLALVEASEVRIWRDRNRSGERTADDPVETGIFGIHIHSGGPGPYVGPWSAGCQVIRSNPAWGGAWLQFVQLLQQSGQHSFAYTLIDAKDLNG
jgi:hypothetical protein